MTAVFSLVGDLAAGQVLHFTSLPPSDFFLFILFHFIYSFILIYYFIIGLYR